MKIYCDGADNAITNKKGWAFVCDDKREDLLKKFDLSNFNLEQFGFKFKEVDTPTGKRFCVEVQDTSTIKQHNYAELVAMTLAINIARVLKVKTIYSDSALVRNYWSLGKYNKKTKLGKNKITWIDWCTKSRQFYEKDGGKILVVSGKDNLADPGWH